MGALTGEAKRQINVLEEEERNTTAKIFAALDGLYCGRAPVSMVRAQFYGCRQKSDELVQSYVLRLRELHCRLQQLDPDGAPTDGHLKDTVSAWIRRRTFNLDTEKTCPSASRWDFRCPSAGGSASRRRWVWTQMARGNMHSCWGGK